jgi:hypothetical protein
VSEVDKWVRMLLISGLHDEETKQAVLSKVDEMPLADTITFVEARETGKISMKILAGTNSSSQVNKVQGTNEKGHGKNPNFDIRTAPPSARSARTVSRRGTPLISVAGRGTRREILPKTLRRRQPVQILSELTG